MIEKLLGFCKTIYSFVYEGSLSIYELLIKVIEKLNEVIDLVNGFQSELDLKECSINITNNRKLSENGDFTGTLCNNSKTACQIVQETTDNKATIDDIRQKIDDKVSFEFIIDGGVAPFTDPPIYEIDGGILI